MPASHKIGTPPLESGDRLTRQEFERRYTVASDIRKAELIEGVVYVASPVRAKRHGRPHGAIMAWLGAYWILVIFQGRRTLLVGFDIAVTVL
jgi:hypothetical protein